MKSKLPYSKPTSTNHLAGRAVENLNQTFSSAVVERRRIQPKYFLAGILSSFMWGFFALPLKSLSGYASDQILVYRIFTALTISLLVCIIFRKASVKKDIELVRGLTKEKQKKMLYLVILSTLFVTVNWFTYIFVVNEVSVRSAAFAYMVCPILTALCGYFILKEKLSSLKWLAIGISILSVSLQAAGFYREVIFSVVVAGLYAVYLILQKQIEGVNKFNLLALQLILSSLLILPYFIYQFNGFPADLHFWAMILVISIFFTLIPLFLNLYALSGMPSSTMGIII